MALDTATRWQLVRDIIVQRKSGVIVLQTGPNYLNWIVENGNLVCISSTFPEASFTQFLQDKKQLTESTNFSAAVKQINDRCVLGFQLVREHVCEEHALSKLLFEHWISCTDYLFDPAAHLFWSSYPGMVKPEFIRTDRPLGEVLIHASRNSITIPTAVRVVRDLRQPFKIYGDAPDLSRFNEEERRVWMHLRAGSRPDQILQDRDIARIPFYKTMFLLWLCGYISDSRKLKPESVTPNVTTNLIQKIPPEWVFPLCAGALIGVLLAPTSDPEALPEPPASKVQPLNESLQRPAWSPTNDQEQDEEEFNAETRSRRD